MSRGIDCVEDRCQQEILKRVYDLFVFEIQQVLNFDLDMVKGKKKGNYDIEICGWKFGPLF